MVSGNYPAKSAKRLNRGRWANKNRIALKGAGIDEIINTTKLFDNRFPFMGVFF
jgi:hypothetical protein